MLGSRNTRKARVVTIRRSQQSQIFEDVFAIAIISSSQVSPSIIVALVIQGLALTSGTEDMRQPRRTDRFGAMIGTCNPSRDYPMHWYDTVFTCMVSGQT